MKNELKIVTAVGVAVALAGCASTTVVDPGLTSYTEVNDAMSAMAANYIDVDGNPLGGLDTSATSWANVPANGSGASATYNGFVGGDVTGGGLDGNTLVGELELAANFDNETISGSADNFYDDGNAQYTGTLTLSGSIATGFDPMITANLAGDLSNGGTDYATTIGLDGWFIGETGPDAVGGYADGTVDGGAFVGVFVAD